MFNGGINLFSKPQLFFKGDRFRIFGKFSYKNTEENFYGIGYNTNKDYVRSDSTSKYRYSGVQSTPGSFSDWATAISLPDLKSTSITTT